MKLNITRARRPDLRPLRQVFVEDVENFFNEGKFYQKKFKFSPKWVNISLCSVLQLSYPLHFKLFILCLPSSGMDFFVNDSLRGPFNLAGKWTPVLTSRWSGGYTVKILS
jgi:hypothetical protein